MEKETKNCPYCGEEIMATAKKCKHCGEWLNNPPSISVQEQTKIEGDEAESSFEPKFLYDKVWMNILFWVTIAGSLIQSIHQSGWANNIEVRGSARSKFYLSIAEFFSEIPEAIGDIILGLGEMVFLFLLMKVFSNFHKPLKELFIANIIVDFLFILVSDSIFGSINAIMLFLIVAFAVKFTLSIQIIRNYEGAIKTLGWIMIGYTIVSAIAIWTVEYFSSPFFSFLLLFLIDFFYFQYLRDTLSVDTESDE